MTQRYAFQIFHDQKNLKDVSWELVEGVEDMLEKIMQLKAKYKKFAIFEVGKCVGDFS